MIIPSAERKGLRRKTAFALIAFILIALPVLAGPYRDSAHGNDTFGVNRTALDGRYAGYAVGNCAHCHEMHASLEGVDPAPVTGPVSHALFSDSFNSARTEGPYLETDNFCFYCHSDISGQQVINRDYSATFGGGNIASGPQSIMASFNQASYHNLYDIWNYLSTDPTAENTEQNLNQEVPVPELQDGGLGIIIPGNDSEAAEFEGAPGQELSPGLASPDGKAESTGQQVSPQQTEEVMEVIFPEDEIPAFQDPKDN